jgi:hypothetical protein
MTLKGLSARVNRVIAWADRLQREFGVLKHQWAMLPLLVRRLDRVRLHVDLTILARLADAVTRTDAGRLAGRGRERR